MNTAAWIVYAILTAAFGYGFWRATRHLAAGTRREDTLRRALHAHAEDMDALMKAAGLPDDELAVAFRKWQERQ